MTPLQRSFLRAHRDNPGYAWERYYRAAWPLYRVRGTMRVVGRHPLPHVYRLLLRALALDLDTIGALARRLGQEESDVAFFAAEMQAQDLVDEDFLDDGTTRLFLTGEGKDVLARDGMQSISGVEPFDLHHDPLSGTLAPRRGDASPRKEKQGAGDPPIRHDDPRPVLSLDDTDAVQTALAGEFEGVTSRIASLVDIREDYPEYIEGIDTFVLRHRGDGTRRIAAYKDAEYLAEGSSTLQRSYDAGKAIIPADAHILEPRPIDFHAFLEASVANAMRRAVDCAVGEIEARRDIAVLGMRDAGARGMGEIADLERRIEGLKAEREGALRIAGGALGHPVGIETTARHRDLLAGAFRDTRRTIGDVIVISPRVSDQVVDDAMRRLIGEAVGRDAYITIGYDRAREQKDRGSRDEHRDLAATLDMVRALDDDEDRRLETGDVGDCGESLLVVDGDRAIVATFDLLSVADPSGGYAAQVCAVFEDIDTVSALRRRAKRLLGDAARG